MMATCCFKIFSRMNIDIVGLVVFMWATVEKNPPSGLSSSEGNCGTMSEFSSEKR